MTRAMLPHMENIKVNLAENDLLDEEKPMKYRNISIVKNKNCNTYRAKIRVGKNIKYISGKTKLECYNKVKEFFKPSNMKKFLAEKSDTNKKYTFESWYQRWFELYKEKKIKSATERSYNSLLNHIPDSFKKRYMSDIKLENVIELVNSIEGERQQQKFYEFLNMIFAKAEDNEVIKKNFIKLIDKPKHKKINGIAFSNEDEEKLEKILIEKEYDIFLLCLYQGLRRGEAMAITIDDIDFENKTLVINKAINDKNQLDSTKNTYSNRVEPLFDNSLKLLEKYKNTTGRLFKYTYKQVTTMFEKLVEENFAGKKYTPHSLRHTFVTKCKEAGIPEHIIQSWVGHNIGSRITNAVYTHTRTISMIENTQKFNDYMKAV